MKPHICRWGGYWRVTADRASPHGRLFASRANAFHEATCVAVKLGYVADYPASGRVLWIQPETAQSREVH